MFKTWSKLGSLYVELHLHIFKCACKAEYLSGNLPGNGLQSLRCLGQRTGRDTEGGFTGMSLAFLHLHSLTPKVTFIIDWTNTEEQVYLYTHSVRYFQLLPQSSVFDKEGRLWLRNSIVNSMLPWTTIRPTWSMYKCPLVIGDLCWW